MFSSPDALELEVMEQVRIRSAKRVAVSLDTEIYKDLGLYGMDVWEIANYFHKKYGTSFENFPMDDYVPPESSFPWRWLWQKVVGHAGYKSLTVNHFVEAARRGAWFEPSTSD